MKLSIVSTMYYSSRFVHEFYKRALICAEKITTDWEMIFVNDGSPDDSVEQAKDLARQDGRVRVIDLSRNFGHHKAILTGLSFAKGEFVFLVDIDLEEQPELLHTFWDELQKDLSVDVVFGVREKRAGGGLFEQASGKLFYGVFNSLSDVKIEPELLIARLMTRRYVENLCKYREAGLVFAGVAALAGFKQKAVAVPKGHKSTTTYSLSKKIAVMIDVITSFGPKPLILMFYAGAILFLFSVGLVSVLLYQKFILHIPVEGWTSVIASIWFFGGLIIFCLGIIGLYVAKTFDQVKNRPFTIVREEFSKANSNSVESFSQEINSIPQIIEHAGDNFSSKVVR